MGQCSILVGFQLTLYMLYVPFQFFLSVLLICSLIFLLAYREWKQRKRSVMTIKQAARVTSVACQPGGKLIVAGLVDGVCHFHKIQGGVVQYHTSIKCCNRRFTLNSREVDKARTEIVGCEFNYSGKYLLVTSIDSRIRLIDMDQFTVVMKFKGNRIKRGFATWARFCGPFGSHIICGSDCLKVYVWRVNQDPEKLEEDIKLCENDTSAIKQIRSDQKVAARASTSKK